MQTKHDMKAILGEDFFKEEVRCDYLIPAYMKKCWAIQLDLYLIISEICEKYNLRYFVMFGGLIGAVRHQGFIPWDDDLDVVMPRQDYEELIKIAPKELKAPYFLRTPFSDANCLYPVIDLVNSDTTFIPKLFRRKGFNMGVPIDIFPLDFCDPATVEEERKQILLYYLHCTNFMKRGCKELDERQKRDLKTYYVDDPYQSYIQLHRMAANPQYEGSPYVYVCNAIAHQDVMRLVWPAHCYEKSLTVPFESIEVKIPAGYDEILTKTFGNYMQFPPVEDRGVKNNQIFFDPDKPYTDYMSLDDETLEKELGIR